MVVQTGGGGGAVVVYCTDNNKNISSNLNPVKCKIKIRGSRSRSLRSPHCSLLKINKTIKGICKTRKH